MIISVCDQFNKMFCEMQHNFEPKTAKIPSEMSTKASKRRTRRVNTNDEDQEKRNPEVIEIADDWSTTSTETEKTDKDDSFKEPKEDPLEDKKENGAPQTEENGQTEPPPEAEITNGQLEIATTLTVPNSPVIIDDNSDIEPLILDAEEPELQLPSETGSETSEIEKSPVLNRCKTRRSQSKNAPTPKTPKTIDFNGEAEKISRVDEDPEDKEENVSIVSVDTSISDKTDLTNASTAVNYGDTTRNNDITTTTVNDEPSFIEITKEKSYGETLRCLTGRKTVRARSYDYKPRFYSSNIDLTSKDRLDGPKNYSFAPGGGAKRKLESDSPGEQKKAKMDDSPGFFSYLSSPFKTKKDIPSSTPKLTGFKFVHPNSVDEIEKVDDIGSVKEPKKWCTVM